MSQRVVVCLVGVGLLALVVWRVTTMERPAANKGPKRGKRSIAVHTMPIQRGDIEDIGSFTGSLEANMHVEVMAKITGRILELSVSLGDKVDKGQIIARIEDDEPRQSVKQAEAALAVARADLEQRLSALRLAKLRHDRTQELFTKAIASTDERDVAVAELDAAKARKGLAEAVIVQRQADVDQAKVYLSYTRIAAPITGFVGRKSLDEGDMASANRPVLSIVDLSSVRTVVSLVEKDYAKMHAGLRAEVRVDAYPDEAFEGCVSKVSPALDPDTRTAAVEIEVANPKLRLKSGMFTRVDVRYGTRRNVLLAPEEALVEKSTGIGLFVAEEAWSTARFVRVKTGIVRGGLVEVSGELKPGDLVVTLGQHLLADGDTIILGQAKEKGESEREGR